jgi:hypothetical protein
MKAFPAAQVEVKRHPNECAVKRQEGPFAAATLHGGRVNFNGGQ